MLNSKAKYLLAMSRLVTLAFFFHALPYKGWAADRNPGEIRDICSFLGGRSDKNFLGSGNAAIVIEGKKARVLFVQQWKEDGLLDWAAGTVRSWYPDQITLNEAIPPAGASLSIPPVSRRIFITRDDVIGMELTWKNTTGKNISVEAAFSGSLPGDVSTGNGESNIISSAPYSDKVPTPLHRILGSSLKPAKAEIQNNHYTLSFSISLKAGSEQSLIILLGAGTDMQQVNRAVNRWKELPGTINAIRENWNRWFNEAIPRFECSDPYFEKLYYYRWWSLYTKMIFARIGHFYHPAPREGTVAYDGVVSYSGACISVDELRWMRDPAWALSTTREFFTPENLNDGYLSNHIWDWGIDNDESNMDALGRSVPYQNYAVDAFYGTLLVHPAKDEQTIRSIWPQLLTNLQSYQRLFDVDKDGLYETYPWSNSAGQEWTARYSYFDPLPEMFRNERSRTYAPDGSRSAEDMELLKKIRNSLVTDPGLHWPASAEELYRVYYATADHRLATVDQATYAYRNFYAAMELAKKVNDTAAQHIYERFAEQTRRAILSVMWNETDHYFYDVQPVTRKQARVKATTGFYVFWAKMAELQHQAMFQHLFNPATFWTTYPLPSLPLDYEKYEALQQTSWTYWNYATWPRTTCHVVDGLFWASKTLNDSLRKNAAALFDRYTRMHFPAGDTRRPNIAERYDPHTGQPFMEELDYNHSTWIDLLMQHVAGITPRDSDSLVVDPVDMGWQSFAVKNIRYRNHNVDVEYTRSKGMTVTVDGVVRARRKILEKVIIQ